MSELVGQRQRAAWHEAGHAVFALANGVRVTDVGVEAHPAEIGCPAGHVTHQPLPGSDPASGVSLELAHGCAGCAAEHIAAMNTCLSCLPDEDALTRDLASDGIGEVPSRSDLRRADEVARKCLKQNWLALAAVARELAAPGHLGEEDLARLTGGSLRGVRERT